MEYWINESRKEIIYDKIKAAVAARMGVATNEGFMDVIRGYEDQVAEIDGRHLDAERIASAWDEMKRKGKG